MNFFELHNYTVVNFEAQLVLKSWLICQKGFLLTDWSTQLHVYSAIDKKILVYLKKKPVTLTGILKETERT